MSWQRLKDRLLGPDTRARQLYDQATWVVKRGVQNLLGDAQPMPEAGAGESAHGGGQDPYQVWRQKNQTSRQALGAMRLRVEGFACRPLITLLMNAEHAGVRQVRASVDSLLEQVYARWQLLVVPGPNISSQLSALLAADAARDSRVAIASGTLDELVRAAQGEWVIVIGEGDRLEPEALFRVVERLQQDPQPDLIYSDQDRLDDEGRLAEPFFKPDWSPDLLMSMNYFGQLFAARRALVLQAGGFPAGYEGAETYHLALRLAELTPHIDHVPGVLYHARVSEQAGSGHAEESARRALADALARRKLPAEVSVVAPGRYRVRYLLERSHRVSIIIPTRDKWEVLRTAVDSIEQRSSYRNFELLIVDNGSTDEASLRYLDGLRGRHRVLRDDSPFNWSALNNLAARQATGDIFLFLNNDVEVIAPDWLEALLEHAQRPAVGGVGARLLYPNGTIQHVGVLLGVGGTANHAFRLQPGDTPGYFGFAQVVRNYSAVTGACLMVRRDVFEALEGFDERLPVAFNDVDFCLRLRERGLLVVYTPHAALYHYESATRGALHPMEAETFMAERWGAALRNDPYYNPNLTTLREDFQLRP